jgi:hypothetical protein
MRVVPTALRPSTCVRHLLAALCFISLASSATWAAAVPVTYVAYEELTSWQPIWCDDVAKAIEEAALEELTRSGLLQLTRLPVEKLAAAQPDLLLRIVGRFVPEAETHTILVSFEGSRSSEIGTFRASDTVVIGKSSRAQMLEKIEASTRGASRQLVLALRPALERSAAVNPPPLIADGDKLPALPWKWSEVRVPKVSAEHADDLFGANEDRRQAALRELTSLALTKAAPRQALERCVLEHKDPKLRLGCLVALRPLSRRLQQTQRVVIEVLRRDDADQVTQEATEQMLYFTGVSRAEAIQAWLERTARDGTVIGPLKDLGDLPNLDLIIVQCMVHAANLPSYKRSKSSCIELLAPIPYKRRRAILWPFLSEARPATPRFLEGAGEREGSIGTEWNQAIDSLTDASCGIDPAFEEILWLRYERTLSQSSMDSLVECGMPSMRLAERLLKAFQSSGDIQVLHGIKRMAQGNREAKAVIKEKLSELVATSSYRKAERRAASDHDLQDVVKELEKSP